MKQAKSTSQTARGGPVSRRFSGQSMVASILLIVIWLGTPGIVRSDHPLTNDPTGINWVFSLEDALTVAREKNRIVMLKPVAFRSRQDSDALSPSAEAQRAVSLIDSRIVGLINRRFVPYYFDMDNLGYCYDKEAADLAIRLYPDMRYLSSMPTPPLLFMSPEGKMLGFASNFLAPEQLLQKLVELLDENSQFRDLTEQENALTDPSQKATVFYDLRRFDRALELLKDEQTSESYFLRGVIYRERGDWNAMKTAFNMVTDKRRRQDVTVEQILRIWKMRNFEGIKSRLQSMKPDHPRYQESMYYLGLAHYHTDDTAEKAIEIWNTAIEVDRKSAWALRLDWTMGLATLGPNRYISPSDLQPSILGRRYMAPDGNPDLQK